MRKYSWLALSAIIIPLVVTPALGANTNDNEQSTITAGGAKEPAGGAPFVRSVNTGPAKDVVPGNNGGGGKITKFPAGG